MIMARCACLAVFMYKRVRFWRVLVGGYAFQLMAMGYLQDPVRLLRGGPHSRPEPRPSLTETRPRSMVHRVVSICG
ncbi:hypothetical protein NDU88_003049 [Pleurodeles waltl]|uniref:Secreted protein n=1 Tax=Pleurodeles waltl TaxID=8319 RepID=A0AAV7Q8Q2_PLEWA|nr:hypothetical protein NDU88_003049 [Pleurodeles waltl]